MCLQQALCSLACCCVRQVGSAIPTRYTRLNYAMLFLLTAALSYLMLSPYIEDKLASISLGYFRIRCGDGPCHGIPLSFILIFFYTLFSYSFLLSCYSFILIFFSLYLIFSCYSFILIFFSYSSDIHLSFSFSYFLFSSYLIKLLSHRFNKTGVIAVYRFCFASSLFHTIMALLLVRPHSLQSTIQNSAWLVKLLAYAGLVALSFLIPPAFYINFLRSWAFMPGAFLFILIQIIILIDFSYSVTESLIESWEEGDDKRYLLALLLVTALSFIASLVVTVLLFIWFAGPACKLNVC